jgi:hypothetical protein
MISQVPLLKVEEVRRIPAVFGVSLTIEYTFVYSGGVGSNPRHDAVDRCH